MAAYAALVSLMHTIQQIEQHPHPPISLDQTQVQTLLEKVAFLQEFLESYFHVDSKEADDLEIRIANAAYAAEDVIDSHIVDQIKSNSHGEKFYLINFFQGLRVKRISSIDLYQGLQKVIQDLDLIMKEVTVIKERMEIQVDHLQRSSMLADLSISHPSTRQNTTMVGFDDVLIEVMDKLTGQQSDRQIIPIVGMGGIGKTTLARNLFVNPLIVHHFDFRGWVTISQEYNIREILLEVMVCLETREDKEWLSQMSEHELGEKLYKTLSGRRYLIVMDDIWSVEAWDTVKFFFPDNSNRSRIIITTRVSNLAFQLSGSCGLEMSFLDGDKSWNLLCQNVFGDEACPFELEEIGKIISRNCKGLPLSIVTIGGLLAKSKQTQYWLEIAENLNSNLSSEDNERCLRILRLSYSQLPVHLKPCFLYMGLFPEDHKIRVTNLIKLWVAEGFLKSISGKSLEEAAEEYLKDLIDRNLILVHELGSAGNIKLCTIHDLQRDLCIKEAEKHKFFHVEKTHSQQNWDTQRRIGIHGSTVSKRKCILPVIHNDSLARSLICNANGAIQVLPLRLLRVLNAADECTYFEQEKWGVYSLKNIFQLVNSRHLAIVVKVPMSVFPSSVYQLWNLQTLVVNCVEQDNLTTAPFDIWKMPQLRHVKFYNGTFYQLHLVDPPPGDDIVVLENLQTLKTVKNFNCDEEVVKRIPNIKKLRIEYTDVDDVDLDLSSLCLENLCRLHKLESLAFSIFVGKESLRGLINFIPHSLKKLTLTGAGFGWEDMTTKIGSLQHLQVLKLKTYAFMGPVWETVECQFPSLKFLEILGCDLEYWKTDSTHFPRLEHLHLTFLANLKKIPTEIGDIPTLKSIELINCTNDAVISVKEIVKEQGILEMKAFKFKFDYGTRTKHWRAWLVLTFKFKSSCKPLYFFIFFF